MHTSASSRCDAPLCLGCNVCETAATRLAKDNKFFYKGLPCEWEELELPITSPHIPWVAE